MRLLLTSPDLWDCKAINPDGRIVYKIRLRSQVSTIWRSLPDLRPTSEETLWTERHYPSLECQYCKIQPSAAENNGITEELRHCRRSSESNDPPFNWGQPGSPSPRKSDELVKADFAKIAEIEFRTFLSTKIRFMNEEWIASHFFRKQESGQVNSDRIFVGPDGKEYQWTMLPHGLELSIVPHKNAVPTIVARLYCAAPLNGYSSLPTLDIFPSVEHMSDLIVATAVYVERIRKDRGTPGDKNLKRLRQDAMRRLA